MRPDTNKILTALLDGCLWVAGKTTKLLWRGTVWLVKQRRARR